VGQEHGQFQQEPQRREYPCSGVGVAESDRGPEVQRLSRRHQEPPRTAESSSAARPIHAAARVLPPLRLSWQLARTVPPSKTPHMPASGNKWRHVIISTRSSWLHGDERGFRSRRRRIHSSGDYKNHPPVGEHRGLYEYRLRKSSSEVHIAKGLRPVVGKALLEFLREQEYPVLVIAVAKVHAHMLVELPDSFSKVRKIIGEAKRAASRAVERQLPGSIWARGGNYKPVKSRAHQTRAYTYILRDQGVSAWTWSFQDVSDEGKFGRVRRSCE
jgi:hypothetical protein